VKYLGIILTFVAVIGVAYVSDWRPEPDRAWVRDVLRFGNYTMYFVGMVLFGVGVKKEAVREAIAQVKGRTEAEPGAVADGGG
jgi:hypothetical protein